MPDYVIKVKTEVVWSAEDLAELQETIKKTLYVNGFSEYPVNVEVKYE